MALSADGLPQQSSPSDVLESGPFDIAQLAVIFDRLGAAPNDAQLVLAALRSRGHEAAQDRFTVADVLRFLSETKLQSETDVSPSAVIRKYALLHLKGHMPNWKL